MALKIDPASGNPWRGKDNKFAASPFAAAEEADAKMKEALGAKLKEIRAKKAAATTEGADRDYFAELPKSAETVNKLKAHRKALSRIQVLEKQRDNATETDKAKRAQRKINRLEKELDPTLPSSEEEAFDLERDIQDAIYRDNSLTNIDPEMTPAEVAKNFDEWVARQPAIALTDDQAIALKRHMNPNRRDVNPDDLVDTLVEIPHNDISGLPLSRGTQLGTVKPGDNLKGFAYESFTPDPEVALLYANAKQLDRSKKPAVITTVAPNGTKAIVPARFDNSQAAQKEVSIGPGYDLIVQDVFDNGKNLEVTAKMIPSSHRQFQPDLSEPADTALETKDFVMPPTTSINTKMIPESGVDKTYYDLAQKRKYVQEQIAAVQSKTADQDSALDRSLRALDKIDQLAGGDPELEKIGRDLGLKEFEKYLDEKNADGSAGPLFESYDSFRDYAHDQAIRWKTEDAIASGEASEADLNGFPPEDRKLMTIFERRGRADGRTPYEQLLHEEDTGGLADVYYDNFANGEEEDDVSDESYPGQIGEFLYHVTANENLASIKKNGLLGTDDSLYFSKIEDGSDAAPGDGLKLRVKTKALLGDSEVKPRQLDEMQGTYLEDLGLDELGYIDDDPYSEVTYGRWGVQIAPALLEYQDSEGTWKSLSTDEPVDKSEDNQSSDLLKKINDAEDLEAARNDSRNFKRQKTTAADLSLANKSNDELYDTALEMNLAKIPSGPLKELHSQYLTNYVTQQKITMLQNQFVMADNVTKTKLRNKISTLQKTLPAGVPSYELAERLRAIQYASTHTPSQKEIDEFIKDSKIKEPVYHSTSIGNLGSIISNGFRAGSGEDAYGTGIYFATTEDNARIYNNSRQNGSEQIVAKTYIKSTQPKVLSRQALTEETKKRLGVKTDFELFKRLDDQKATVAEIINEYYAQGYDSVSVRA